jgi:hypothetical protein
LVDNNWKLVGNGLCLNSDTKKLSKIGDLVRQSNSLDYYEQDFYAGDIVIEKDSGDEFEIKSVVYNKFDGEYQYWCEDEDGEEWYGLGDEFEKVN